MAERSSEQILDQAVYAVASVAYHYGPGFSEEGLQELRKLLADFTTWRTDVNFRVDMCEDDPRVDFYPGKFKEADTGLDYDYVVRASKDQLVEGVDYVVNPSHTC